MADVYEFHVTGLVGPVIEAALPELTIGAPPPSSVLIGTADNPDGVTVLLGRLAEHGLVADHILLSDPCRWRAPEAVTD